jgi:hypothetical protein
MPCNLVAASLPLFAIPFIFLPAPSLQAQGRSSPLQRDPYAMNQNSPFPDDPAAEMSPNRVSGTVHTFNGSAVAGSTVHVRSIDRAGLSLMVTTDPKGNFALNLPPGNYEILATDGASQSSEQIQVRNSGDPELDIRLPNKASTATGDPRAASISVAQMNLPAKARAEFEKAQHLMTKGNPQEAMKKANHALEIAPRFAEARTLRGILYARSGQRAQAEADYRQAIKDDSKFAFAYIALGSLLNSTGHFAEAMLVLAEADHLAPNFWQTSFELGRTNLGKRDFHAALAAVDRATELIGGPAKEPAPFHLLRGFALLGLNELARARDEIQSFLARESTGRVADNARKVLQKMDQPVAANR